MILDYEQELSTAGGQLFNATDGNVEYGTKPYDLKAAGQDAAVGEPLDAFYKIDDANSDVGTSYDIAIVNDTDGAGGSAVVMTTKTVLVAALTVAKGVQYIGRISPALCALRYLTARVTTHGGTPTAGKMKIWLQKSNDGSPRNIAFPA